jgi:hypothetical protein
MGGEGAKLYDDEKAWSSLNHSILYGVDGRAADNSHVCAAVKNRNKNFEMAAMIVYNRLLLTNLNIMWIRESRGLARLG